MTRAQVISGVLDPSFVITHVLPLHDIKRAYDIFHKKADGCLKVCAL
jgi:threonine dehydrogenase-like Zn-dependent dehydrogenase